MVGNDSAWLLYDSEMLINDKTKYGAAEDPYVILTKMNKDDFNTRIKRIFTQQIKYTNLKAPYYLFSFEEFVIMGLCFLFFNWIFVKYNRMAFRHDQILWVRKVSYPAPFLLEISLLLLSIFFLSISSRIAASIFVKSEFIQTHMWASTYCLYVFGTFTMVASMTFLFSMTPKKLMVVGDEFVIKSLTSASRRLPLQSINSIKHIYLWELIASPGTLWAIKWRIYYLSLKFWKPALVITLKDSKIYLFSCRDAISAKKELVNITAKVGISFGEIEITPLKEAA